MSINKYPYTDFNEYNLDWVILKIKEFEKSLTDYEALYSITFGGDWDISKSYTQWTIVSDPITHDGYLSLQPVPANVQITNTDYWLKIADYTTGLAALDERLDIVENEILKLDVYTTPEMFGAVGDGITDDTAALQNCFNNSNYVVMTKLYKVSSGLYLHSNLIIDGINQGKIIKDQNILTDYSTLYYYGNSTIDNLKIKNIELHGLKHWTGVTVLGYANDYGIRIINAENTIIENCRFLDFGACAVSVNGKKAIIDSNIIKYTGQFSGNLPNYNFGISYEGEDFKISNNYISGVIHGIISGIINKNIVISENNISTNGQHGLYMEGAESVIVKNNFIHDCTIAGIKFQRDYQSNIFSDIEISNNIISDCGGQGILIVSLILGINVSNVIINGNTIKNSYRCIDLERVFNCSVSSNIIELTAESSFTAQYILFMRESNNISISDNKLTATNCNCIWFNDSPTDIDCNNVTIKNNDIKTIINDVDASSVIAVRVCRGDNLYINGNTLIADSIANAYADGIYIANTVSSINRFFILNNISYGFRWDIRITDNTNANIANCYYANGLGV